jgi:predicted DNA-binding protein
MDKKVMLNIRIPRSEMEMLEEYCNQASRTKTEVLREFIRSLKREEKKQTKND